MTEPGTPAAGKEDGESRAAVELVKDIPKTPNEAEFVEPKNVWTHPEHRYICIFATVCKLLTSTIIVLVHFIMKPFQDQHGETYYGVDEVWCHENGVCMTKEHAREYSDISDNQGSKLEDFNELKENSGPFKMVHLSITHVLGTFDDDIAIFLLLLFWIYYWWTGKVLNNVLGFWVLFMMLFSWYKFAVGWLLISAITKINHVFMWGTPLTEDRSRLYNHEIYTRALRLSPMLMSLIFLTFILDVITFAMLIVARDPGTPGMSHRKRLMLQQEARKREEELEAATPRRKSYVPEEMSHHDKIISEMSLNKKGDNLAPGSVAGGGGSALRVVASSTRGGGSKKASMVSTP